MKKLMMLSASMIALGALAQEVPVPPPVAPVPPPVVVAAPVPVPVVPTVPVVVSPAASLVEAEPGALCKIYSLGVKRAGNSQRMLDAISEHLVNAVPVDQGYDTSTLRFDGKQIAKHECDVARWDGVFIAKQAGKYVFTVDSDLVYSLKINDKGVAGAGQQNFEVELKKGANPISFWRYLPPKRAKPSRAKWDITLDYRLSASTQPAKPIVPAMLSHIVMEEGER